MSADNFDVRQVAKQMETDAARRVAEGETKYVWYAVGQLVQQSGVSMDKAYSLVHEYIDEFKQYGWPSFVRAAGKILPEGEVQDWNTDDGVTMHNRWVDMTMPVISVTTNCRDNAHGYYINSMAIREQDGETATVRVWMRDMSEQYVFFSD